MQQVQHVLSITGSSPISSDRQQSFVYNNQETVFIHWTQWTAVYHKDQLGPLEFVAYTLKTAPTRWQSTISPNIHMPMIVNLPAVLQVTHARQRLSECSADLVVWCA